MSNTTIDIVRCALERQTQYKNASNQLQKTAGPDNVPGRSPVPAEIFIQRE